MFPTVTNVSERKALDNRGAVSTAIVVTYTVGTYGPFTLVTNQTELNNGQALAKMQQFASTLQKLPLPTPAAQ